MKAYHLLIATSLVLALATPVLAQADPHHPEEGEAPAAVESAPEPAPTPAPAPVAEAAAPMMQHLSAMQMMNSMQMMHSMMMMMHSTQMTGMQMMMQQDMMMPNMEMMQHGGEMPAMGGAMPSAPGADPDVTFVQSIIAQHHSALTMADAVLRDGDDQKVKAWARELIAARQAEIGELQAWLYSQRQ